MNKIIRVAILDDHQSIIDGYIHRLSPRLDIEIIDYACCGEALEPMLEDHVIDVLLLDIHIPTAPEDDNPYPILDKIPHLLEKYPNLNILVVTMYNQATMIKAAMEGGASGYILKDDFEIIGMLGKVVKSVAGGDIILSSEAHRQLHRKVPKDQIPSPRQLEILSLCSRNPDATTAELAEWLGIAHSTARNLLSGAYLRMGVQNRTEAIMHARRLGFLSGNDG